jgi:hypothetical protein
VSGFNFLYRLEFIAFYYAKAEYLHKVKIKKAPTAFSAGRYVEGVGRRSLRQGDFLKGSSGRIRPLRERDYRYTQMKSWVEPVRLRNALVCTNSQRSRPHPNLEIFYVSSKKIRLNYISASPLAEKHALGQVNLLWLTTPTARPDDGADWAQPAT